MTTTTRVELSIETVQNLPLPPHHETDWSEYYRVWRLRRRLLDALVKAGELQLNVSDITVTEPTNYLHLIKAVRSRISIQLTKNARARYNEQRRKSAAAAKASLAPA